MIAIIDYGMGNLHSVRSAVKRLGYEVKVTADQRELMEAEGAILPGVGAFGDAMAHLQEVRLVDAIKQYAASGKPLLGICLGMQLLFTSSEEFGEHEGLQLLSGRIIRFQGDYKVPHMGWNTLEFTREHKLLQGLEPGHVYFVHSYHAQVEHPSDLLAVTDYHQPVTAIVGRDNVFGMQFHPEKSGQLGMQLLAQFLQLCN